MGAISHFVCDTIRKKWSTFQRNRTGNHPTDNWEKHDLTRRELNLVKLDRRQEEGPLVGRFHLEKLPSESLPASRYVAEPIRVPWGHRGGNCGRRNRKPPRTRTQWRPQCAGRTFIITTHHFLAAEGRAQSIRVFQTSPTSPFAFMQMQMKHVRRFCGTILPVLLEVKGQPRATMQPLCCQRETIPDGPMIFGISNFLTLSSSSAQMTSYSRRSPKIPAFSIPRCDIWPVWKRLSRLLVWISQLNWQDILSLTRQLSPPRTPTRPHPSSASTTSGKTDELSD